VNGPKSVKNDYEISLQFHDTCFPTIFNRRLNRVTLTSSVPTSAKILYVGAPQAEIFSFKGLSRDKNGVAGRAKMSQMSG
jgi:hypothetical protein